MWTEKSSPKIAYVISHIAFTVTLWLCVIRKKDKVSDLSIETILIIIYILVACFFLANWAFANLNNFSKAWQLLATFWMPGASELALCALHGIKLSWTKECKSSSELQLTFSIWKFIAKLCKSFRLCPWNKNITMYMSCKMSNFALDLSEINFT